MSIDDHLGLLDRSFGGVRLVVLTGMSGSGKSTCIELLLHEHPDFAGQPHSWIGPAPIDWTHAEVDSQLVVVDELLGLRDLWGVLTLLRRGHTVLAASHLSALWIFGVGLKWPRAHFRTDRATEKLGRYLDRRGVQASTESLRRYANAFGANYTDLDIILDHTGLDDFDRAIERFQRSATIELVR